MKSNYFSEFNVGIDTGQTSLDISIRPSGECLSVENDSKGIRQAIRFIKPCKPVRVLIVASERLEMDFFCAAHKAGLRVCVCNPIQVRKFAQAAGTKSEPYCSPRCCLPSNVIQPSNPCIND